jgi:hypothetical protein
MLNGRSMRGIGIGLLGLFATPAVEALERSDISFYLSFEDGLLPEIASGDTEVTCSAGKLEEVSFDPAVPYWDYGCGGLAYPERFQQVAPKARIADQGKPISLEIGRHSYAILRFHE